MGWDFGTKDSGQSVHEYLQQEMGGRIVASALIDDPRESECYFASRTTDGTIAGAVALIREENEEFGFKVVIEDMGPFAYRCPLEILQQLSPTEHPWSLYWRRQCYLTLGSAEPPLTLPQIGALARCTSEHTQPSWNPPLCDAIEVYQVAYDVLENDEEHLRAFGFTPAIATRPGTRFRYTAAVGIPKRVGIRGCLEEAFRVTQHVDRAWESGPGLLYAAPAPNRSTSVGDVLVRRSTGTLAVVLPMGFQDLSLSSRQ